MIPFQTVRRVARRVFLVYLAVWLGLSISWVYLVDATNLYQTQTLLEAYLIDLSLILSVSIYPTLATVVAIEIDDDLSGRWRS